LRQLLNTAQGIERAVKSLQKQIDAPSTPQPGLNLQLALRAPQFDLQLPGTANNAAGTASAAAVAAQSPGLTAPGAATEVPPATPPAGRIQLRDLRLELAGSPADATLALDGSARLGTQQFSLSTKASGGIAGRDQWRVALASLHARAKLSPDAKAEPWSVELDKPINATLAKSAAGNATTWRVQATAGDASLRGPVPNGLLMKHATNLVLIPTMVSLAEAAAFVRQAGLSMEAFASTLLAGQMASDLLRAKLPKLVAQDWAPHSSTANVLLSGEATRATVREAGGQAPLLAEACRLVAAARDRGLGDKDVLAMSAGAPRAD